MKMLPFPRAFLYNEGLFSAKFTCNFAGFIKRKENRMLGFEPL